MPNRPHNAPPPACRGKVHPMKQDYRRPLNYRRHPNYMDRTEALALLLGILVSAGVLFAAYVFGPSVYPWLESMGVGK